MPRQAHGKGENAEARYKAESTAAGRMQKMHATVCPFGYVALSGRMRKALPLSAFCRKRFFYGILF